MRETALLKNRVKYIMCKQLDKFLASDVNYLYEKSWRLGFGRISYRLTYYMNGTAVFVRYRRHAASSTSTSYCHDIWAISHAATVWLRAFQTEASSRETRSIRRKDCHGESCLSIRHSRTKGHCRCIDSSCLCVVVVVFCSFVFQLFVVCVLCIHFLQYMLILHNLLKMPSIGKSALVFWNCEFSRIKQVKLIFVSFLDLLRL